MKNLLKVIIFTLTVGTTLVWLFPGGKGRAAPQMLPSCGHSKVSSSSTLMSARPDIAHSNDTGQTYTAVAWAGDQGNDPVGKILLSYSDVQTTTRQWKPESPGHIVVDSSSGNRDVSIVFDPVLSDTVHLAYRKGDRIYYAQCDLTAENCPVSKYVTNPGVTVYENPQIAVLTDTVVIVYQDSDEKFLKYAYIANSGSGGVAADYVLTANDHNTIEEDNPTVVAAGGRLHAAYVKTAGAAANIEYINMELADIQDSDENGKNVKTFANVGGVDSPDFPTIDAVMQGEDFFMALVWEVKYNDMYSLVYNISNFADGSDWEEVNYLFLPSNGASNNLNNRTEWASLESAGDLLRYRLQPDMVVDDDKDIHVVWHAQTDVLSRFDVLYTRFDYSQNRWETGSPVEYITRTPALSYTNVTTVYAQSEFSTTTAYFSSKIVPKIVFGKPYNRLQMVYMSQTTIPASGGWDIVYNGWQLGTETVSEDSDCDWIADSVEIATEPQCNPPGSTVQGNPDCDSDKIPDFMDENSDGDSFDDFIERPTGAITNTWRTYPEDDGGVYMPVITKNF